jgi:hypothetical protein
MAFAIAVIADLVQVPITAGEATGVFAIPGEVADFFVDCVVMAATTRLLGFHWILLPTLFLEIIPGLDLLPTWTGCVAYVVVLRKKKQAQSPPLSTVIDIGEVKVSPVSSSPVSEVSQSDPEAPLEHEAKHAERNDRK